MLLFACCFMMIFPIKTTSYKVQDEIHKDNARKVFFKII